MSVWKISWQNLKSKPLYTFLSVFTLSLSILLLLGVQQIKTSFKYQMENNLAGIDLVVGAKGSALQLVLASVLHLDNPTGNIPYEEAKKMGKNPLIEKAIPLSYGDNYKGYRIVGTTNDFRHLYEAKLNDGRDVEESLEVVLGSAVAQVSNLSIGDTFLSSHGLIENDIDVHDDEFKVVGILEPTQKVIDQLIITNLESIWDVHDHDHGGEEQHDTHDDAHEHHEETHDEHNHDEHNNHESHNKKAREGHTHKAYKNHKHEENHKHAHKTHENDHELEDKMITSVLISFRNPTGLLTLPRAINEKTNMQAALPKYELDKLYNYLGIGLKTLSWIAYLILVISGLTIFISLYKMVKERAFDLALLRTYGATNFQLIKMVAYEGFAVTITAFIIGILLVKQVLPVMFNFANVPIKETTLKQLPIQDVINIGVIVFVIIAVAIAVAVYPIIRMRISEILSDEK